MPEPTTCTTAGEAVQNQRVDLLALILDRLIGLGAYGAGDVSLTVDPRDQDGVVALRVTTGTPGGTVRHFRVDADASIWNPKGGEMTRAVSAFGVALGYLTGEIAPPVRPATGS